jgi:exonuclease III
MPHRILALNIRHGGGRRIRAILAYLASTDADTFVLGEYRNNPSGDELAAGLVTLGYDFQLTPTAPGNSVAIISRRSFARVDAVQPPEPDIERIRVVRFADMTVAGVYFACGRKKRSLFDYLLGAPAWLSGAVVMGDFNTGRAEDSEGRPLPETARFEMLTDLLLDLWRRDNSTTEISYRHQSGLGFRIDHALGDRNLHCRVLSCRYDHSPRESAISDHSAIVLDISDLRHGTDVS